MHGRKTEISLVCLRIEEEEVNCLLCAVKEDLDA